MVNQLELQETELKSKINSLNIRDKDHFPLQKYIHDELWERLNFLTETLALIRQYDQELTKLIQKINPSEPLLKPPAIHQYDYFLSDLFSI